MIVNVTIQVKAESLGAASRYVEAVIKAAPPTEFRYPVIQNEGRKVIKAEEAKR